MKLIKALGISSAIIKISFLSIACTYTHFTYANEQKFNDCFSEDFSFTCNTPQPFLSNMGIDIKENIIPFQNLHQTDKTTWGCHKGSFHADQNGVEYFVKSTQMMNEFIGSRLLNIILDTKRTPIVKLVDGKENGVASQRLKNFIRQNNIKGKTKNIIDEIPLAIALDYIGIMNRGGKNMGYIVLSDKDILAARVDVDKSFTFGELRWKGTTSDSDHLNLHLLQTSIKNYPKDAVIDALKKVTNIPDEKIVMTVLECWATLIEVGYPLPLETGTLFAQQLVERKHAFTKTLEDLTKNTTKSSVKEKKPKEKIKDKEKKKDKKKIKDKKKDKKKVKEKKKAKKKHKISNL